MPTSEDKLLVVLCHGSIFIAMPIILPLIVLLLSEKSYVKTQAKEALIFHLAMSVCLAVSGILVIILIGFIGLIAFGIIWPVLTIIAIIKVLDGQDYSYPVTGPFARNI